MTIYFIVFVYIPSANWFPFVVPFLPSLAVADPNELQCSIDLLRTYIYTKWYAVGVHPNLSLTFADNLLVERT